MLLKQGTMYLKYLVSSSFILKLTYVWEEARRTGEQQVSQDSSRGGYRRLWGFGHFRTHGCGGAHTRSCGLGIRQHNVTHCAECISANTASLISCSGVIGRCGLLSHVQNAVRWLAFSLWQVDVITEYSTTAHYQAGCLYLLVVMHSRYKTNWKWWLVKKAPQYFFLFLTFLKHKAGRFCSKMLVHDIANVGLIIVSMHYN